MTRRTITRFVDFQWLATQGDAGIIVIKLMMACNDMQLANEALSEWKEDQPPHRKYRQSGAAMYFIRLQMSHLFEALKIVEAIRNDTTLMAVIGRCDSKTQKSFQSLTPFLTGGLRNKWLENMVGQLRSNLVFHYNETGKLIDRAIADRAKRTEARYSPITRGSTAHLWHFKPADDVVDSVVVRQIWKVPRDKNVRVESDQVADEIHQIFLYLVNFAGDFIWKYCGKS